MDGHLLQAVADDLLELDRNVRVDARRPQRLVVVHLQRDVTDALALEGKAAGHQLVEDDAK